MVTLKVIFRLFLILLIPIAVAAATYIGVSKALMGPANPQNKSMMNIEISPGSSFSEIAINLKKRGILKYDWSLTLLARFKKQDTNIKAGEYSFSPSMTPKEILNKLANADMIIREVKVIEGYTISSIAKLVEAAGIVSKSEFEKASQDPILLAKAGIAANSFEGFLFPETYHFSRPITAQQVVWRMFTENEKNWDSNDQKQADNLNLSRYEVITLASIIEKESGNKEEQPMVSSVFHNRIKEGMKLQSDPTVIYGISNFNGNLTKADLLTPHPYNTYVNFGLPPGPICNPGKSAIKAAIYPATTDYLYFVGDNQGKHIFSKNLADHNLAVLKYQKQ